MGEEVIVEMVTLWPEIKDGTARQSGWTKPQREAWADEFGGCVDRYGMDAVRKTLRRLLTSGKKWYEVAPLVKARVAEEWKTAPSVVVRPNETPEAWSQDHARAYWERAVVIDSSAEAKCRAMGVMYERMASSHGIAQAAGWLVAVCGKDNVRAYACEAVASLAACAGRGAAEAMYPEKWVKAVMDG